MAFQVETNEGISAKETSSEREVECDDLPRADVIRRLRSRSQPITLFGETEAESRARLRKLEIEQVSFSFALFRLLDSLMIGSV